MEFTDDVLTDPLFEEIRNELENIDIIFYEIFDKKDNIKYSWNKNGYITISPTDSRYETKRLNDFVNFIDKINEKKNYIKIIFSNIIVENFTFDEKFKCVAFQNSTIKNCVCKAKLDFLGFLCCNSENIVEIFDKFKNCQISKITFNSCILNDKELKNISELLEVHNSKIILNYCIIDEDLSIKPENLDLWCCYLKESSGYLLPHNHY